MREDQFADYIRRFNAEDATAFDDYLAADMVMTNGSLTFTGVDGMRHHYEDLVWPHFVETLKVLRFVSNDDTVAVQMHTNFVARHDADTLFGPVKKGEQFDYRGLIMYELRDGKFSSITVAFNSFVNTRGDGTTVNIGIPH
ncbi:MAG: nuclear transport factor 2 family protein [Sphingomonas sp.]|uniref:nuclear transport factor 2 family protein n=1 Tax=Sphingomonas sp. TaxID=28214 RepID=UPI002608C045|nr:nuclear transport factor 2 family protein [Sphingomonas sp.]MDK2770019.1 nuclear transport factor 2 family protein [Sphingomonas sp.]